MSTTINTFRLTPISPDEISATSLREEASVCPADYECYRIESNDTAEVGWLIFSLVHLDARAGIAWGSDAQWTDCSSAEDAVERFLGLDGKEMDN